MSIKYFCDSCKKEIVFSDSVHFEQEEDGYCCDECEQGGI